MLRSGGVTVTIADDGADQIVAHLFKLGRQVIHTGFNPIEVICDCKIADQPEHGTCPECINGNFQALAGGFHHVAHCAEAIRKYLDGVNIHENTRFATHICISLSPQILEDRVENIADGAADVADHIIQLTD
jgi:hypothetical protein